MLHKEHLLNSKKMAEFVVNGYLRFDELIPKELCEQTLVEMASGKLNKIEPFGLPFNSIWRNEPLTIAKIFRLPQMQGIIQSLVGPNPRYDHHFPHLTKAGTRHGENLHQDAEYDPRFETFDIQISFFATDVTPESGGTLFVPGSHFRRVHESSIKRYQNIVGQEQCVCKAGTIIVWHQNIWHSARSNLTSADRFMFKLRLNPTVKQQLLWDTEDLNDPLIDRILQKSFNWHGRSVRVEEMNRVKLWRHLTNQPEYDLPLWSAYWRRIENQPENSVQNFIKEPANIG